MLQQTPSERLTIEAILTHPWFKLTIVDKLSEVLGDGTEIPATPGPGTPLMADKAPFFSEPLLHDTHEPSSSRILHPHSSVPSPLSTNLPQIASSSMAESEPSETSFEFADSEHGKQDSGTTTPTTAEDEEAEPIKRNHSGELSQTEKGLELLHQNGSQSTIRRSGSESPGSATGSVVKNRVAVKSSLEGQAEVDEEAISDEEMASRNQSASLPITDEHSPQLPHHSRTPSRTKRRSVTSTMSLERRHSHHSQSGQWQAFHPEDYLARLNEDRDTMFSTPSEKQLLSQLSALGFDIGQLVHSVNSDACDASAATWWILRQKQLERGETDEVILARSAVAARRQERTTAYTRDERRKARAATRGSGDANAELRVPNVTFKEETRSIPASPSITISDLGAPVGGARRSLVNSLEVIPNAIMPKGPNATFSPPESKPTPIIRSVTDFGDLSRPPQTPPREPRQSDQLSSPTDASPSRFGKTRSPSVSSMLQRATSAFVGSSKKSEDLENPNKTTDARSISPTKLMKPTLVHQMIQSDSEATLLTVPRSSPSGSMASLRTVGSTSQHESDAAQEKAAAGKAVDQGSISNNIAISSSNSDPLAGRVRASKRDSLWSTFRHLFIEDKKRRKGDHPGSPLAPGDLKVAPAVVLSRGIAGRTLRVNRVVQPINVSTTRRPPAEPHSHVPSRRSSSVHSRRSSVTSKEIPNDIYESLPPLARRHSHCSHGSHTPNSDREYQEYPSRPSSVQSTRRGSSRKSSQSMRSPSGLSDLSGRFNPTSPLHAYHRMSVAGFDSKRVRHYRPVAGAQILRSGSKTSSLHSNASSRASSVDRNRGDMHDSDYDTGRDDPSIRSKRRKSSAAYLAQQIHRARSPLPPGQPHTQRQRHGSNGKRRVPLRDVFKQKTDEWVSDDEESPTVFAGGLGQGSSSAPPKAGHKWAAAAAHPSSMAKQRGRSHRQGQSRSRRGSSEEEKEKQRAVISEVPNLGGARRTGLPLPDTRGRAPPIEEEEEEDE